MSNNNNLRLIVDYFDSLYSKIILVLILLNKYSYLKGAGVAMQ